MGHFSLCYVVKLCTWVCKNGIYHKGKSASKAIYVTYIIYLHIISNRAVINTVLKQFNGRIYEVSQVARVIDSIVGTWRPFYIIYARVKSCSPECPLSLI